MNKLSKKILIYLLIGSLGVSIINGRCVKALADELVTTMAEVTEASESSEPKATDPPAETTTVEASSEEPQPIAADESTAPVMEVPTEKEASSEETTTEPTTEESSSEKETTTEAEETTTTQAEETTTRAEETTTEPATEPESAPTEAATTEPETAPAAVVRKVTVKTNLWDLARKKAKSTEAKVTFETSDDHFSYEIPARKGYVFTDASFEGLKAEVAKDHKLVSGTVSDDAGVITLNYDVDEIGEKKAEEPDAIPDRFQVTFTYTTDGNGTIRSGAKEVVTRLNEKGEYSETAAVSPRGDVKYRGVVGYEFAGWTDEEGGYYVDTKELRKAAFLKDMTFTAMFFPTYVDYFYSVEYYYDDVLEKKIEDLYAQLNEEITKYEDGSRKGYALDYIENYPLVIGESPENVIRVRYATDKMGPKGKKSDGVPDKYQLKVTYKSEKGGKISGSTSEVATLTDKNGNWSIAGGFKPAAKIKLTVDDGWELFAWQTSVPDSNGLKSFNTLAELRKAMFTQDVVVTAVLQEQETEEETTTEEETETSTEEETTKKETTKEETAEETTAKKEEESEAVVTEEETTEEAESSMEESTEAMEYELSVLEDQKTPLAGGFLDIENGGAWRYILVIALLAVLAGGFDILRRRKRIKELRRKLDEK